MRRSATFLTLLGVFSGLALAESWQGRLLDASCYEQHKSAATCDPTGSTTEFALFVANKPYRLDATGNSKAAEALKSRADRSSNPSKPTASMINAKVSGSMEGENIKVDTIDLQ
jgi:hypothetical protein